MAVTFSQPDKSLATRVVRFTGTGTWTVPAGVTYAIATCVGGGGGSSNVRRGTGGDLESSASSNGSPSSVDFPSPVVANGGPHGTARAFTDANPGDFSQSASAAQPNSGRGASASVTGTQNDRTAAAIVAGSGGVVVGGSAVTPGAVIAVTVGAGGSGNAIGAAGGSGSVMIEFQEEVFV